MRKEKNYRLGELSKKSGMIDESDEMWSGAEDKTDLYEPSSVVLELEDEDVYLGARGIKFHRHPGAHLSKKPGRWIVAAELVETTRLFGRGIAAIEPQWIEDIGGHLLKKQMLDPHWEKKAAQVSALERATLYGIVIYNNRRVNFGKVDPHAARYIFIREALVNGQWETPLPFLVPAILTSTSFTRSIRRMIPSWLLIAPTTNRSIHTINQRPRYSSCRVAVVRPRAYGQTIRPPVRVWLARV